MMNTRSDEIISRSRVAVVIASLTDMHFNLQRQVGFQALSLFNLFCRFLISLALVNFDLSLAFAERALGNRCLVHREGRGERGAGRGESGEWRVER